MSENNAVPDPHTGSGSDTQKPNVAEQYIQEMDTSELKMNLKQSAFTLSKCEIGMEDLRKARSMHLRMFGFVPLDLRQALSDSREHHKLVVKWRSRMLAILKEREEEEEE